MCLWRSLRTMRTSFLKASASCCSCARWGLSRLHATRQGSWPGAGVYAHSDTVAKAPWPSTLTVRRLDSRISSSSDMSRSVFSDELRGWGLGFSYELWAHGPAHAHVGVRWVGFRVFSDELWVRWVGFRGFGAERPPQAQGRSPQECVLRNVNVVMPAC